MFFNKMGLALLILGVIMVAGCTSTVTPTAGNGLEITNFTASQGEVYKDSHTQITLGIENQGDATVPGSKGGILLIGADDWTPGNVSRIFSKDMKPADPQRPADRQIETWTLTGPPLGRGQTRAYTLTGRVYYDYSTTALGSIIVYPQSEATAAQNRGETLQTSTWSVTKGPVQMDVSVAPDPVVASGSGETFTVQITLTNTDGGVVYKKGDVTSTGDSSVTTPYAIPEIDLNIVNLSVTGFDSDISISDTSCYNAIQLVGSSATTICDVTVNNVPSTKKAYSVTVKADYGYYTDQQMMLTAIGKD